MNYDGSGPHAWFFVTNSPEYTLERNVPRPFTLLLRDDDRSCVKPPQYTGVTVKLKMPQNEKIQSYKAFMLYCLRFDRNFCYVKIPEGTQPPAGTGGYTETCKPEYIEGGQVSGRGTNATGPASSKSVQVVVPSLLSIRVLLGTLQFMKFSI